MADPVLSSRDRSVAAVRTAVRGFFDTARPWLESGAVAVAVSGGADSLALAAVTIALAHKENLRVRGLIVEHGLQEGSAAIAAKAATQLRELGADDALVLPVTVDGQGGPEAAARTARYAALRAAAGDALVLLGHTRDDQAETVLLGLGRGSGPRSLSGMRALDPPWARPLLDVGRADTVTACAALGITTWQDPHNSDPRFTRARLRDEVLPLLEDVLHGGVAGALARTARQIREDAEALDLIAERTAAELPLAEPDLPVAGLTGLAGPIRRRVLRRWLLDHGAAELSDAQLRTVEEFVTAWRGQGATWLPGALAVTRNADALHLR